MITLYTEDALLSAALSYFRLAFPGVDLSDRSFFGLLARSFARFFALAQRQIEVAANDSVPAYQQDADGQARSRCSGEALDAWAFVFGLASGTPGIYGRRGATVSTGGVSVPAVTVAAVVVPAGTQATDPTGQVTVQTVAAVTLNGPPNSVAVQFVSITKGAAANLPTGTRLTWASPPAGLVSSTVLSAPLVGGQDVESDSALVARILRRIQQPPRGGTAADYRAWGEESVDSDEGSLHVARAYTYPLREGLGSVTLVPTYGGSGLGRQPPAGEVAKIQSYLNRVRPITATVYVRAPTMFAAAALRIRAKATPSSAKNGQYGWDWADGGTPTTITARTATSVTVAAVPAALSAAYAAGTRPRIQVIISTAGASPIPYVGRVTAIAGTTLTVEPAFTVLPTITTDYFYAGGSIILPVAQRILAYVDQFGPSRASGFADANDSWDDGVLLERVIDEVMDTRDVDGTAMVVAMPGPIADVVKVAVGGGAFLSLPYRAKDNDPLAGPELCYLRAGGIEVLQA